MIRRLGDRTELWLTSRMVDAIWPCRRGGRTCACSLCGPCIPVPGRSKYLLPRGTPERMLVLRQLVAGHVLPWFPKQKNPKHKLFLEYSAWDQCSARSSILEYSALDEKGKSSRILCFGPLEYCALECSNTLLWNSVPWSLDRCSGSQILTVHNVHFVAIRRWKCRQHGQQPHGSIAMPQTRHWPRSQICTYWKCMQSTWTATITKHISDARLNCAHWKCTQPTWTAIFTARTICIGTAFACSLYLNKNHSDTMLRTSALLKQLWKTWRVTCIEMNTLAACTQRAISCVPHNCHTNRH